MGLWHNDHDSALSEQKSHFQHNPQDSQPFQDDLYDPREEDDRNDQRCGSNEGLPPCKLGQ